MIKKEEQQYDFKPLSWWRELLLKEEDLSEYYRKKREYQFNKGELLKGMKWKDILHPILLELMTLNRKFIDKQTLKILKDERNSNLENKPVIYAITHIGKFDYQIVSEAIRDHQYPFAGDPETMYRSADGLLLGLNGIVMCDTESKMDREIASATSIEVLHNGKNLLIYPEGVWNITSDLLCLPLFPGIIKMAHETGCDIVPVAIEQYGNDFIVNIGSNYRIGIDSHEMIKDEEIEQKKEELRDILATLKWQIMETIPSVKRTDLGTYEEELENFQSEILNEWVNPKTGIPYYNLEIIKHRTFKPKNVSLAADVYKYFKDIKLNKNNAFMFRKDSALPLEIQRHIMNELNDYFDEEDYKKIR